MTEETAVVLTPCAHRFHLACFVAYVMSLSANTSTVTCPLCRERLYDRPAPRDAPRDAPPVQARATLPHADFKTFVRIVMFALAVVIVVYILAIADIFKLNTH